MTSNNSTTVELPSLEQLEAWNSPILFDELESTDISANLLPGIFGKFAERIADMTETPESLSVMTILGVISTCIAKHFVVSPKAGWLEPTNIYTLIALPPANNKSLVLNACTKPLVEWEKEQAKLLESSIKHQNSERKTLERYRWRRIARATQRPPDYA